MRQTRKNTCYRAHEPPKGATRAHFEATWRPKGTAPAHFEATQAPQGHCSSALRGHPGASKALFEPTSSPLGRYIAALGHLLEPASAAQALDLLQRHCILPNRPLEDAIQNHCSKRPVSLLLYSVTSCSVTLCTVHEYERVHTSIYIYIYIYITRIPRP